MTQQMTKEEAAKLFQEMGEEVPKNLQEAIAEEPKRRKGRPRRISGSESSTDEAPAPAREGRQIKEIRVGLTALFEGAGKMVGYFDQFDGMIISGGSPALVDALCRASQQNAALRAYLASLVHVSAWGDVTMAAAFIIIPILAHHNLLPFSLDIFAVAEPSIPVGNNNGHSTATMG